MYSLAVNHTPPMNADKKYESIAAELEEEIKKLQLKLAEHAKGREKHWGHVGDLQKTLADIKDINLFLQ